VWDDWELVWKVHNRKHTTGVMPSEIERSFKRWFAIMPLLTVVVMLTEEVLIQGVPSPQPQAHQRPWYAPKVEVVIDARTGKPTVNVVPDDPKPVTSRPARHAWLLNLIARW
jgi:hypothetical protein